jgi:hypothetical protein
MEQKNLTKKQVAICKELVALMRKAAENGIMFVFDESDYLLSAYNGKGIESVDSDYSSSMCEGCVKFDWQKTIDIAYPDYVNSNVEDVYINFE